MIPRIPRWPLAAGERALLARHLAALARTDLSPGSVRLIARTGLGSAGLRMHAELLAHRLEAGVPLSRAIGSLDASFGAEDEAIIAAGERSGDVARALEAWGDLRAGRVESERALRHSLVLVACLFGVILVSASAIAGLFMPTLSVLFLEQGASLPAPSRLALATAHVLPGLIATTLAFGILLLITWLWRDAMDPRVLRVRDRLALGIPGLGQIEVRAARWLLLETMAAAAHAGQPPHEAMDRAAAMQRNAVLSEELARAAGSLRAGESLSPGGRVLDAVATDAIARVLSLPDPAAGLDRLALREKLAMRRASRRFDALARPVLTIATAMIGAIFVIGAYAAMFRLPMLIQ
jgi:general secretion pathway protein F